MKQTRSANNFLLFLHRHHILFRLPSYMASKLMYSMNWGKKSCYLHGFLLLFLYQYKKITSDQHNFLWKNNKKKVWNLIKDQIYIVNCCLSWHGKEKLHKSNSFTSILSYLTCYERKGTDKVQNLSLYDPWHVTNLKFSGFIFP